ncbi:MAG: hypothetical protein R2940_13140 [Syntrophotaleaceae bacterium]
MNRKQDIERFYTILRALRRRQGIRKLSESHGRMNWPRRGVYFFFEEGEFRENGQDLRVVRVGTHAVSTGSRTTLWSRLRGHKGTNTGGGNHRGSIFRLHVGSALIKRGDFECPTWGRGSFANQEVRALEHSLEVKVTQVIGAMPFVWVEADDSSGSHSIRAYLERNAIALLSNVDKEPIDPVTKDWLGLDADRAVIGKAGLWNVNHVGEPYDSGFIEFFEKIVQAS